MAPNPPRDTCYYDGLCGMCRRTTRTLRALDLFRRLDFVDLTSVPESELPVPLETAMRGMPMRTRAGRVLVGFPAIRRALLQTVLSPVAWPLYLPGISHVAAAAYRHIAANRRRQCAIDPRRGSAVGGGSGGGGGEERLPPPSAQRILRP